MIISNNQNKIQNEEKSALDVTKLKKGNNVIEELDLEVDSMELRPKRLVDVIGQSNIVKQLGLILESAKIRDKMPEHMLFFGQPGLGKTTISSLIASELEANFKMVTAPSLQKIGDVVSLLISLEENTVLFIDEIHRLKAPLEETLYSAMEDNKVDLVMGKGSGVSTMNMDINPFVLIGATTMLGRLSKPLKDRFPSIFLLEHYSKDEMIKLIERSSLIIGIELTEESKLMVSERSRGVPRIANNILKRLLDYKIVHNYSVLDIECVEGFFEDLGVFEKGLTKSDIVYLRSLLNGTVGIKTISSIMQEDVETIELVIEPYLLHLGYVDKSSGGRSLTSLGRNVLIRF